MRDLLLSLSGADRDLLLREAPRDRVKYEGIGGAVLLTAGMAAVSSTVAVQMAFDAHLVPALVFGLVWGAAMLSLDRWLVSANQRQDSKVLTLLLAVPRLVFALVVGLIMSTPLTLLVFDGEIHAQLVAQHQERKDHVESRLREDSRFRDLSERQRAVEAEARAIERGVTDTDVLRDPAVVQVKTRLAEAQRRQAEAEGRLVCETEGTCGSGQAGRGPARADKEQVLARASADAVRLQRELQQTMLRAREAAVDELGARRDQLAVTRRAVEETERRRDDARTAAERAIDEDDGLLARLEALHHLSQERPTLGTAHLLFYLFLTLIEILPVLIKLLLAFGKPTLYERLATAADEADAAAALRVHESRRRDDELVRDASYDLRKLAEASRWQREEDTRRTAAHVHRQELRMVALERLDLYDELARTHAQEQLEQEQAARMVLDLDKGLADLLGDPPQTA